MSITKWKKLWNFSIYRMGIHVNVLESLCNRFSAMKSSLYSGLSWAELRTNLWNVYSESKDFTAFITMKMIYHWKEHIRLSAKLWNRATASFPRTFSEDRRLISNPHGNTFDVRIWFSPNLTSSSGAFIFRRTAGSASVYRFSTNTQIIGISYDFHKKVHWWSPVRDSVDFFLASIP